MTRSQRTCDESTLFLQTQGPPQRIAAGNRPKAECGLRRQRSWEFPTSAPHVRRRATAMSRVLGRELRAPDALTTV